MSPTAQPLPTPRAPGLAHRSWQPLQAARSSLFAFGCAAVLLGGAARAQVGTPPSGGNFTPIPGTGGAANGSLLGNFFGGGSTAPAGSGGGMCKAAEGGATCGGTSPSSPGNTSGVNTGAGNPINVINGNKYQMEVDLPALPGELGIEIVRYYNSANRHVVGQLGMGWRLSYETDLYAVGQTVQILLADGGRLTFAIDPKNPSVCAGTDPAQGWVEIVSASRGGKEYLWHWTHGEAAARVLRFDGRGKLVQITAASGAVLAITRGPKGELVKVTDPQGRSLTFNHGGAASVRAAARRQASAAPRSGAGGDGLMHSAPGLAVFTGIQSIDSPVGRFGYTHGSGANANADGAVSAEQAELAQAQAANLTQVSLPTHVEAEQSAHDWANRPASTSAIRRQYHYEDARHPQALTGISVAGSGSDGELLDVRLSTYRYDEHGRATLSVRGEAADSDQKDASAGYDSKRQAARGIEQVQLRILEPALPTKPGRTLLTNSLGQETLYTHQVIAGEYRLLEAVGAGCAGCGPVNLRWRYDDAARLVEQTTLSPVRVKDGKLHGTPEPLITTRHVRAAGGKSLRIEQVAYVAGKAQPPQLIERQEYADSRWPDKPTLIARPSVVQGAEHQIALSYNEAGQVTEFTERGWSLLDARGGIAATPRQATPMARSTTYEYRRVNGRSLLVQVDGPLVNGSGNSAEDSDITALEWDTRGSFITAITTPGGLRSDLTHNAATGLLERVVNDAGFATAFTYDTRQQPTRIQSEGPGWREPQVQTLQYDALGHPVQRFEGEAGSDKARPTDRWGYDLQGRLLWHASAIGLLQTQRYDSEGHLLRRALQSASMAQALELAWDDLGRPIASRDNAGRTRALRYGADGLPDAYRDALGRVIATAPPAGPASAPAQRDKSAKPAKAVKTAAAGRATASAVSTQRVALRPRELIDDFGRAVLTVSSDSGTTRRTFDAADRLTGMTDAQGNEARYAYDAQGRIREQTIVEAAAGPHAPAPAPIITQWRYDKRRLLAVDHPTQSERFEYDPRGLRSARIVSREDPVAAAGEGTTAITAITRYEHDAAGELIASTLPDGSRIRYERNGQGQVVAVKRQTIRTPWLRWLASEQTIARDFERDLVGLRSYVSGNGIEARFERSATGELARVRYRHPSPPGLLQTGQTSERTARSATEYIERMLGIAPAAAQTLLPPVVAVDGQPKRGRPGALDLPHDPQALIDHRYLWSAEGHLLKSEQRAGVLGEQSQRSHAYDAAGRLVASVQAGFDWDAERAGAVPVSVRSEPEAPRQAQEAPEQRVWRYAYDARSRRVLSQEAASQADLTGATVANAFEAGSHRLSEVGANGVGSVSRARYNASGQPERLGEREYAWDALGRLAAISEQGRPLARYGYDHRGLRIAKQVSTVGDKATTTRVLYDESRQPLAELNGAGRITRQYVWIADLPLAVIDAADSRGAALTGKSSALAQIWADLGRVVQSWLGQGERVVWLHTNHLGAPEAATDARGHVLWRASYTPFGAASITVREASSGTDFTLDLRFPGQVFDAESGLHYNRQRHYDPELGQYLTPDPLGTPDGPNPYAYVAFNPLGYVDPDGLVLFAFDGTDNGDPALLGSSLSNVVSFRDAYLDGERKYVTGVGTDHLDSKYGPIISRTYDSGLIPDRGGNYSGPDRMARMMLYFVDAAEAFGEDKKSMDIDIIGFSRGAAQARHFANLLADMLDKGDPGVLRYQKHNADGSPREEGGKPVMGYQCVNFRFMGLFDTVLSTNRSGTSYNMAIPSDFKYVAQAVALNEYRSAPAGTDAFWTAPSNLRFWDDTRIHLAEGGHYGGFPLQSIGASSSTPGKVRIELGFIGAHSDIGGGYGDDNGLSKVALSWMVGQAQIAGVKIDASSVKIETNSPVYMHDQSNVIRFGDPTKAPASFEIEGLMWGTNTRALEDRQVLGGVGGGTQRTQSFGAPEAGGNRSMTNADTHGFISYLPRRPADLTAETIKNPAHDTRPTNDIPGLQGAPHVATPSNLTGTVNMSEYLSWLRTHGYALVGSGE